MPEGAGSRGRGGVGRFLIALALIRLAALAAGPAFAAPDAASRDLQLRLAALEAAVLAPVPSDGQDAAGLIAAVGLPVPEIAADRAAEIAPPPLPRGPAEIGPAEIGPAEIGPAEIGPATIGEMNLRLALTMLDQASGDADSDIVLAAQAGGRDNLPVLRAGTADVRALARLLQQAGFPARLDGHSLTLGAPLLIWPGAALTLGEGEALLLDRARGAFVLNPGRLAVTGGAIRAIGGPATAAPSFRPFVTTAEGGSLALDRAGVSGLGFGDTAKFAGIAVLRSLLAPEAPATAITGSRFDDLRTLAIRGEAGPRIAGNRFRHARAAALVIAAARDARVEGNLFAGAGADEGSAIRVEAGATGAVIAGNVILGGKGAGIFLRAGSSGARIAANTVWHRDGAGISVEASPCARIAENLVVANRQKGIAIAASPGSRAEGNTLLSNRGAALWIAGQPAKAETGWNAT